MPRRALFGTGTLAARTRVVIATSGARRPEVVASRGVGDDQKRRNAVLWAVVTMSNIRVGVDDHNGVDRRTAGSDVDWTLVRAVALTGTPLPGSVRSAAACLVIDAIEQHTWSTRRYWSGPEPADGARAPRRSRAARSRLCRSSWRSRRSPPLHRARDANRRSRSSAALARSSPMHASPTAMPIDLRVPGAGMSVVTGHRRAAARMHPAGWCRIGRLRRSGGHVSALVAGCRWHRPTTAVRWTPRRRVPVGARRTGR